MRNQEGVWDWQGKGRIDLKAMGRFLTNREIYIYFKDCIIAQSRKLSGVVERHCESLEFAAGVGDSDGEVFQEKFEKYIRAVDDHLNSESIEAKFAQSDVCDSTHVILNRNRTPGSRGKGKDNAREG